MGQQVHFQFSEHAQACPAQGHAILHSHQGSGVSQELLEEFSVQASPIHLTATEGSPPSDLQRGSVCICVLLCRKYRVLWLWHFPHSVTLTAAQPGMLFHITCAPAVAMSLLSL